MTKRMTKNLLTKWVFQFGCALPTCSSRFVDVRRLPDDQKARLDTFLFTDEVTETNAILQDPGPPLTWCLPAGKWTGCKTVDYRKVACSRMDDYFSSIKRALFVSHGLWLPPRSIDVTALEQIFHAALIQLKSSLLVPSTKFLAQTTLKANKRRSLWHPTNFAYSQLEKGRMWTRTHTARMVLLSYVHNLLMLSSHNSLC